MDEYQKRMFKMWVNVMIIMGFCLVILGLLIPSVPSLWQSGIIVFGMVGAVSFILRKVR